MEKNVSTRYGGGAALGRGKRCVGVEEAEESLILCSKEATKLPMRQHDQGNSSTELDSARVVLSDESRGHEGVEGDTAQDSRKGKSMGESSDQVV
jgi:hypothetical protein